MNSLADKFASDGVGALFIYTHEAHPGEHYPHHTSFDQKMRHAHDAQKLLGITRPLLVDDLSGKCHRAYGSMPNMSWIISRSGRPLYKADWTDAEDIESAMEQLISLAVRRKLERKPVIPYTSHRLVNRLQDRQMFIKGLERSGPKAVAEYLAYKELQKKTS